MTRVVVQRSQGATNPTPSRSASSSAAPTPPPLPPPHLPSTSTQALPFLARSSSPPSFYTISEEDTSIELKDVESSSCGESQSTSSDTIFRSSSGHYAEGKVKESSLLTGRAEDEDFPEHSVPNENDGRELYITSRSVTVEGRERDLDPVRQVKVDSVDNGSGVLLGGDVGTAGLTVEQLRLQQEEDVGPQVDAQRDGSFEGEEEDTSHLVQSMVPAMPFPQSTPQSGTSGSFVQLPFQSQGANVPSSSSTLVGGVEVETLRTHQDPDYSRSTSTLKALAVGACSFLPAPSALPVPPTSRKGGWVGSSPSSASRAGGSSRRIPRSIKASRSPPHNSRSSSPRSYGEGDGYNSADEQNPWALGQPVYEDNDDREHQFELEIRRVKGLEVCRMAEDGNCLFRAVADQVYGDADMHGDTRQMCIDYMEKERDHYSQFVVSESFSAYCKRKRRDKVYGNNLEIQAMAEMYNRPIHIFCYGTEPQNIFQGSYQTDLPPIRLSYHRGNHYNSLVDPTRSTIGAGLGFGSLNGANIDRDQVKAAIKAQQDQQIDKALLAEGRYYSDLELTEQEMERMVIEASRAEFLAEEYGQQIGCVESSTSAAGTSTSQADNLDLSQSDRQASSATSLCSDSPANTRLTSNMRTLLSMGFSYFRVVEACSIFGDDINDMLCYLLEAESGGLFEESLYRRMKGKAAER